MVAVNKSFQSGHARAFVKHDPLSMDNHLFVMNEDRVWTFDRGSITSSQIPEGALLGNEYAALAWSDVVEDGIVDMFKAIAKALEIYSDEPSQAYRQGFAEGEAKVLREWNETLR